MAVSTINVGGRFDALLDNLSLTREQFIDGEIKYKGVIRSLNTRYYETNSETTNSLLVGS